MDLTSLVLAPVRIPLRVARALDDLTAIADRARRDPDPVEEVRERLDLVLAEVERLRAIGGALDVTLRSALETIELLTRVASNVDVTGQQIVSGGQDLTATAKQLDRDTRSLITTAGRLEDEMGTVAETVEPLQGAAERVGRVTKRLSRTPS